MPIVKKKDAITAWHWLPSDGRLRYGDRALVTAGQVLTVEPPIVLCERGLHASRKALDSLSYAPGPILCRVRLWGHTVEGDDKLAAQNREVVWIADATEALHLFACDVAESALKNEREKGREPHAASWRAIEVKRAWVRGEASDEELAAARDAARGAARDAAWAAARDAAWAAAWAAARAAAWGAAWAAARDAARDAAWGAAWAAAWDAAWGAQEALLTERLLALGAPFGSAETPAPAAEGGRANP